MRKSWLPLLFLLVSGIFVYWFSIDAPFTFDDYPHLVENQRLQQAKSLNDMLHSGFQETRPLFGLSMALTYKFFGLRHFYYHLISLTLHLATALIAWQFLVLLASLRRETSSLWLTFLPALIFTLHPLQTESVSYSNSRSGLLMGLFLFASCWSFCKSRLAKSPIAQRNYLILTGVLTVLSMLAKESGAVIPFLLLWIDLFLIHPEYRPTAKTMRLQQHAALWATTLTVPILFLLFKNPHQGTIGFAVGDTVRHALTQINVLAYFIKSFLVPVSQNLDYDFPFVDSIFNSTFIVSFVLLACLLCVAWLWRRQRAMLAFGIAWFFATIAPTNSIVPFKDFIAERHLYVPLFGLALCVGQIVSSLCQKKLLRRYVTFGLLSLWLIFLALLTIDRNQLWSDEIALWGDTVAKSPIKPRPLFNLGAALADHQRYDEAESVLKKALSLAPDDAPSLYNLGMIYKKQGRCAEAIPLLKHSLAVRPNHALTQSVLDKCLGRP